MEQTNNNYVDFINNIYNPHQLKILMNIFTNESVCYLTKIIENNNNIDIHILGQQVGNKPRSSYIVTIDTQLKKLKCNCKDFIFRSETRGIVCKHISYIVFRCAKIYSNNYVNTKVLQNSELTKILAFIHNKNLWSKYSRATFSNIEKIKEEHQECPICCEIMEIEKNDIVSCPTCKNVVHEECIRKWLKYNKSCVYCRSKSWKEFV